VKNDTRDENIMNVAKPPCDEDASAGTSNQSEVHERTGEGGMLGKRFEVTIF
jgi:hypothetical protein